MQGICSSCGEFKSLRLDTGWCKQCLEKTGVYECGRCHKDFRSSSHRPFCSSCRQDLWLESNADKIEFYVGQGLSVNDAIEKVRVNNHFDWICVCCTDKLTRKGLFCNKLKCRSAQKRFYRRVQKGQNITTALHNALKD